MAGTILSKPHKDENGSDGVEEIRTIDMLYSNISLLLDYTCKKSYSSSHSHWLAIGRI